MMSRLFPHAACDSPLLYARAIYPRAPELLSNSAVCATGQQGETSGDYKRALVALLGPV